MWNQLKKIALDEEKEESNPWEVSEEEFGKIDPIHMFDKYLAKVQRGKPEEAMVDIQMAYGGGVLNPIVENVGDLSHRMSEAVTEYNSGYEYVNKKVDSVLYGLTHAYGFEREMMENIESNARAYNISADVLKEKVFKKLKIYANEHRQLPVFNEAQKLARDAAVAVGEMRWRDAITNLKVLKRHLDEGPQHWKEYARSVDRNLILEDARQRGQFQ